MILKYFQVIFINIKKETDEDLLKATVMIIIIFGRTIRLGL